MRHIGVGTFTASDDMKEAVNEVLDTGRLSYGPFSREFEKQMAKLHGCDYGVLSNSGTSSLQVALQTLKELHGMEDGSKVIVPAVTFVATPNVVLHNRMEPILVDVDPVTYTIDPSLIEEAMTADTEAIIPVHLFGQPADMTSIMDIADVNYLRVIEDSCECVFATHDNQTVGSFGDITCFSTYVAHIISTGVGGIATTDYPEYATKMRSLVNHGRDGIYMSIDDDDLVTSDELVEIVARRFNFKSLGHSFRITELEAALGVAQLKTAGELIAKRQYNAARLTQGLAGLSHLELPQTRPGNTHSFMMYPILETRDDDKWPICNYLEGRGIETREMLPLTTQPVYRGMFDPAKYPVADMINRRGFYIGCHQDLTDGDIDYVLEVFHDYYR